MEFPSSISVTWEDTTMKLFSLSLNEKQIWNKLREKLHNRCCFGINILR